MGGAKTGRLWCEACCSGLTLVNVVKLLALRACAVVLGGVCASGVGLLLPLLG